MCRTLPKEAKKLQLIKDNKPRDHRPILMKVTVVMNFEPLREAAGSVKWSQDAFMAAWHRGAGWDAFLMEVEK
eukprot:13628270-Heterocapsa_arctica.AAC.1